MLFTPFPVPSSSDSLQATSLWSWLLTRAAPKAFHVASWLSFLELILYEWTFQNRPLCRSHHCLKFSSDPKKVFEGLYVWDGLPLPHFLITSLCFEIPVVYSDLGIKAGLLHVLFLLPRLCFSALACLEISFKGLKSVETQSSLKSFLLSLLGLCSFLFGL